VHLKRAEEATARLHQALAAGAMATWDWELSTGQVVHSGNASALFGRAFSTAEGAWQSIHPADLPRVRKVVTEAIEQGVNYRVASRLIRQDGEVRWHETVGHVHCEAGNPVRVTGVTVDITERREAEAKAQRLAALVEATPDFVAIFQPDGLTVYINAAGRDLVDLPDGSDTAHSEQAALYPRWANQKAVEEWMPIAIRDGSVTGESVLQGRGGQDVPVSFVMLAHRNEFGEVEFLSAHARDIRHQRELTEHLQQQSQQKDEFIAVLAHELRNPMAPIRFAAETLATDASAATVSKASGVIRRQAAHMTRLLDDLLEVSRVTLGIVELQKSPVNVTDIVEEAAGTARVRAAASGHRITTSAPREPILVDGDRVRLLQVITNLLDNALKNTPPGGSIEIRLDRGESEVAIVVSDNGVGIRPDRLVHIFGMFNRDDARGARAGGGLGIGLALAKRLTEMHGGTVSARSEGIGKGAQFEVRLPLSSRIETVAPSTTIQVGHAPASQRILIVDDNVDSAETLATLARMHGFTVQTAFDGATALAAFDVNRPSTVIMDLGLPDSRGDEVAMAIRARSNGAPVKFIALTGWGQAADRERTKQAGFVHHLVKPVDPMTLMQLLRAEEPATAVQDGLHSTNRV
jgi:signal transduction histidine kinase/CheY-like chemotaxis protein